jgi:hypothetical protein
MFGMPCGVVPRCPEHGDGYIGAEIDRDATEITRKEQTQKVFSVKDNKRYEEVVTIPGRQITRWKFLGVPAVELAKGPSALLQRSPTRVQFDTYYLKRLQRRELLPADEESARHCAFHVGRLPEPKTPAEKRRQQNMHIYSPPAEALAKAYEAAYGKTPAVASAPVVTTEIKRAAKSAKKSED